MRVLVAEDEQLLADTIATGLRNRSIAVDVCYDGQAALQRAQENAYDVIVLDRDLPNIHGDQVCRTIVARGGSTRVLMLTAASGLRDRVEGLDLGADDYLGKPFAFEELVARVHALGRRSQPPVPPVLKAAGLEVDVPRHQASRDGSFLRLSRKEFGVLAHLVANAGRWWKSAEEPPGEGVDENRTRSPTLCGMRDTGDLAPVAGEPPVIETITGAGYRIKA